ncbi:sulfonate transport system substrate-binding protein [Kaistia hirudinis]|uniref:Sulfonate transport system substrate-binding protein n=1 Tax=Kaistia hirudinis TaxID=1293440 RepID=A0A840AR05_9HYPH|nr:NrtA/SsuA/CpmA family ABC transporter substrate-binding protein [Kaistia hirudinis]MBB3932072.1 sulfonate transport system substrate-binding protein [Kaistia hirudinis]
MFAKSLSRRIAIASVGLILAAGTALAEDNVTFRVAYLPTANYLTTVRTTGILEEKLGKVGAKVEFIGPLDPFSAYNTVTAGNADASSTGTGYFVNLSAQKSPWVAFALEKYSGNSQGLVAAPGSGVNELKDLYGKKVGIDGEGATGDYILNLAFKQAGLDVSKVEKVTLDTTSFASAFASGQVAAIASYDQNLANAIATPGAKVLVTNDQLPSYNWSIHIVSRDFAEKHREALKAAYEGLVAESERAHKNPAIITDAYKEFGASDGLVKVVAGFDTPTILPLDEKAVADLNKLGAQYVEFGFIDKAPDIADYVVDLSK